MGSVANRALTTTDHALRPTIIKIHLKRSECDRPTWTGVDVFVSLPENELCPVFSLLVYTELGGAKQDPSSHLRMMNRWQKWRSQRTLDRHCTTLADRKGEHAGHSFQSGAATMAATVGIEDSTIQALGRWTSHTVLCYIHTLVLNWYYSPIVLQQLVAVWVDDLSKKCVNQFVH